MVTIVRFIKFEFLEITRKMTKKTLVQRLKRAYALTRFSFYLLKDGLMPAKDEQTSYDPRDGGINEQTINERGEGIERVSKEFYSDLTSIIKKGKDGKMYEFVEMPNKKIYNIGPKNPRG